MKKMFAVLFVFSMVTLFFTCAPSSAAPDSSSLPPLDYPTRQITITSPGGAGEAPLRVFAGYLSELIKVPVVVEAITGAKGVLQLSNCIQKPADGYTMCVAVPTSGPWTLTATQDPSQPLPWKPEDFTIVCKISGAPSGFGIIVDAKSPYQTLPDLINEVRSKPAGTYNFAVAGPGRIDEVQFMEFEQLLNVKFNRVFYGSPTDIQTDLLTGDVVAALVGCNNKAYAENKTFRILSLLGESVPADFPVQTLPFLADYEEELGFEWDNAKYMPLENGGTYLAIKTGTDPRIIEYLNKAILQLQSNPDYISQMRNVTYPVYVPGEEAVKTHLAMAAAIEEYKAAGGGK